MRADYIERLVAFSGEEIEKRMNIPDYLPERKKENEALQRVFFFYDGYGAALRKIEGMKDRTFVSMKGFGSTSKSECGCKNIFVYLRYLIWNAVKGLFGCLGSSLRSDEQRVNDIMMELFPDLSKGERKEFSDNVNDLMRIYVDNYFNKDTTEDDLRKKIQKLFPETV